MTLYSCVWPENGPESLVLDASSAERARDIATEIARGEEPARVVAWAPNTFVAAVKFVDDLGEDDEDADDDAIVTLEPLDHVAELLERIEDASDDAVSLEPEESGVLDARVCGDVADYEGEDVKCTLESGHDGEHQGRASDDSPIEW